MLRIRRFVVVAAAIALGGVGAVTAVMASSGGAFFSPQKSVSVVAGNGVQGYSDIDMDWNLSGTITSTGMLTQSHENDDFELGSGMSGTMTSTESFSHSNRVALSIALEFSVSVTSVVDLHNSGWGYGEIIKLYEFAQLSGKTPDEIQAMRTSGLGWGQIAQTLGINVGEGNGHDKDGDVISGHEWLSGTVLGDPGDRHGHDDWGKSISGNVWLSGTVIGDPGKRREHDNEDSHGSGQQGNASNGQRQVGKGEDHRGRSNSGGSSTNNNGVTQHQQNNGDNQDSSSSDEHATVTLKVSNSNRISINQSSNHDSNSHDSGEKGDD